MKIKHLIPLGVILALAGFGLSLVLWISNDKNALAGSACCAAMIGGVALAVYAGQHRSSF